MPTCASPRARRPHPAPAEDRPVMGGSGVLAVWPLFAVLFVTLVATVAVNVVLNRRKR